MTYIETILANLKRYETLATRRFILAGQVSGHHRWINFKRGSINLQKVNVLAEERQRIQA